MGYIEFGDKLINKRLRNEIPRSNCTLIVGQQRTGKSTLFVPVAREFHKLGYDKIFCNFPMKDCYAIPTTKVYDKKSDDYIEIIDKKWLYHTNLKHCVVLIDEAAHIWGSREYSTWTQRDSKFFTELGKNDTVVFMVTQFYDLIDLNCKRACDREIFLTRSRWLKNVSYLDCSELISLKVQEKNKQIVGVKGIKEAYPCHYELCVIPQCQLRMYRKPFYNDFDTHFSFSEYEDIKENELFYWDDFVDFNYYGSYLSRCFDEALTYMELHCKDVKGA